MDSNKKTQPTTKPLIFTGGYITRLIRDPSITAADDLIPSLTQEQLQEIKAGRLRFVGDTERGLYLEPEPTTD